MFGVGARHLLGRSLVGQRVLLICSSGFAKRPHFQDFARQLPLATVFSDLESNPTLDGTLRSAEILRSQKIEAIVAVGGGSALDTGKVLSWLLAPRGGHLFGGPITLESDSVVETLPLYLVPTTAGTGSEVTQFATLWDRTNFRKLSISSPKLFAKMAFVDPELTLTLSWENALFSALDALTQCFESIWSRNYSPDIYSFALSGIRNVLEALDIVREGPSDIQSRERLMLAGLYSGLCISVTRTALCHSISYPLTAHFGVPHGLACGFTLPAVLKFNAAVDDGRLNRLAKDLGYIDVSALSGALEKQLLRYDLMGQLCRYVRSVDSVYKLTGEMLSPGRADNNLRTASESDVSQILNDSLNGFQAG